MIIGFWKFSDDDIGADFSGWGNHGQATGVDSARPLASGGRRAADFDGGASIAVDPSKTTRLGNNSFTVEAWLRPRGDGTIIASDNRWAVGVVNGELVAHIRDMHGSEFTGSLGEISYSATSHIAVLFDTSIGAVSAYINGVESFGFAMPQVKKLDHAYSGTMIGAGLYGGYDGVIDNLRISTGIKSSADIIREFVDGTRTHDYIETILAQNPALVLAHDTTGGEYEPYDLAMSYFDIDDSNFNEVGYFPYDNLLWSRDYTGVRLVHTGFLTLTPRHQIGMPTSEGDEGERLSPWSEPMTVISSPFPTSAVEFIASDLIGATGDIVTAQFAAGDSFTVRVDGTNMLFEESAGDSYSVPLSEWMHVVVSFQGDGSYIYINGQPAGATTPTSRSGLVDLEMLNGFTGAIGPIVLYQQTLSPANVAVHHDIAYSGVSVRSISDTQGLTVVSMDEFRQYQYNWTVVPA